jgi:hypothetical protein
MMHAEYLREAADTIDRLTAENERLREAIRAHKREFYGNVNYDDAPTANDEALWAAIEDVAPTPPQPRNGGLLSCEYLPGTISAEHHCNHWSEWVGDTDGLCCWCGSAEDDSGSCPGPVPSTGEDGGHG